MHIITYSRRQYNVSVPLKKKPCCVRCTNVLKTVTVYCFFSPIRLYTFTVFTVFIRSQFLPVPLASCPGSLAGKIGGRNGKRAWYTPLANTAHAQRKRVFVMVVTYWNIGAYAYPFSLASRTPHVGVWLARLPELWRNMASVKKTICCRFCRSLVPPNKTVHLFTNIAVQKNWPSRITQLLEVPVERQQQFSNYMCITCSSKIERLERAVKEL